MSSAFSTTFNTLRCEKGDFLDKICGEIDSGVITRFDQRSSEYSPGPRWRDCASMRRTVHRLGAPAAVTMIGAPLALEPGLEPE